MSDISVIGLGLMGGALAHAIARAGHELTVWNRSPEKTRSFDRLGVSVAVDLASAIRASPVTLICIDNYATTRSILSAPDVIPTLRDRVFVQLSSGTPNDAEMAAEWMAGQGAHYLDGAILGGPTSIGTAGAQILLSGDEEAHEKAYRLLECLGDGTVKYLGRNFRAASTLDLAWLMTHFGSFIAAIHAANLCRSENVPLNDFSELVPDNPLLQHYARVIDEERFDKYSASLQVWGEALHHIQQQGVDAGINTEIPDFIATVFERAVAAGHGQKHVMSLIKVLQDRL